MQIDRLFGIIYALLGREKITAEELADKFCVSKRTVLRDIDALSVAGIPIESARGKGGGISLSKGYVLDKANLTQDERNELLFSLQAIAATGRGDTQRLRDKLRGIFSCDSADWIEVDFSRWGNTLSDGKKFNTIKQAVLNCYALKFRYASSYGENSLREVYPLKMLFKGRDWYLQSYCLLKQDYRVFKINRMSHIEVADKQFDSTLFSPPSVVQSLDCVAVDKVKLRFLPQAAYRVLDEFYPEDIKENIDGSFSVEALLPCDKWLVGYVLSFGDCVEVESPLSLRQDILNQAEKIKNIYKK